MSKWNEYTQQSSKK